MKSIEDVVESGGATMRYRSYYGGQPLPEPEVVWERRLENNVLTLYHYGMPLVHWNYGDLYRESAWLSEYSQIHELSVSDKNGIRIVNASLV